ncbi:hypothetical protein ACIBCO_37360 [Streptomyces violascens]|uniref:hypothetical protein n=1 Tax=Streptomyces violascens TaxID=67381 RepID=UPI0037B1848A
MRNRSTEGLGGTRQAPLGRPTGPTNPTPTTLPKPGRLSVSYHHWDLRLDVDTTLDRVAPGTMVTATGTVITINYLGGASAGHAIVVLTDNSGNSAMVQLSADVVDAVRLLLSTGVRVAVRGTASAPVDVAAGIDARSVLVVND